jgi:hypothetical protein
MLNNKSKLFFPKIKFEKSVELTHNSGDSKIVNLYSLDWTHKENKCNNGESELSFKYEEIIKNSRFAISDSYLDEIRRVSWCSISEFNTIRNLESSIKQIYLKPTVAYISSAFALLNDSIFDADTNFYYRGKNKIILTHLLLYKFWKNQRQIPASMILDFANIPELLTISMNETMTEPQVRAINEFLSFINEDINIK